MQSGQEDMARCTKQMLDGGEMVAIKRAKQGSVQGGSEFKNEIELLSRVHHKNLVGLVGFCFEQEEQMLVYEYIPNGTLGENLTGKTGIQLDWGRRLRIALGSARGLTYLHELADPPIIHRDIKSANILLDMNLTAKVADFGLSKLISDGGAEAGGKSYVSTQVKGTLGYLDPEYFTTMQLSEKSDVYSFGIVLLELITARTPLQDGKFIVRLVNAALNSGGISGLQEELMDPFLKKCAITDPLTGFKRFLSLALSCIEESGSGRPTMREVVKELESIVEMGSPADSMLPRRDDSVHVKMDWSPFSYYNRDMEAGNSSGNVPKKEGYNDLFEYSGAYNMSHTILPK